MRPMHRTLAALALTGLACSTAACSGGSGTPSAPIRATSAPAAGSGSTGAASTGFTYDASFVNHAQLIGPASFGRLGLDVALPMHDARGLTTYAQEVSNPKSGTYRHFLTPEQIADRFGASPADQTAAITYFHRFGIWASGWKQRMLLHVGGTQAQLEAAFHTKFGQYRSQRGETFLAPMTAPHVDAGVPVIGSANIVFRTKRYSLQLVPAHGSGTGYSPQQIAAAFDYTGAYQAGYTGSGITIGIVGTGPIQTSTGGKLGDADAYKELYHVSGASTVNIVATTGSDPVVNAQSGFAPPPPVTGPCNTASDPQLDGDASVSPSANCNPEDGEAQLDTEQASSLARDATVEFYLAYNPNDGCPGVGIGSPCPAGAGFAFQGLFESDEELQTIIDHNTADVVSASFGGAEFGSVAPPGQGSPPFEFTSDGSGLDPTEFAMMVSEGMSVFISSGDAGANSCQQGPVVGEVDALCVEYPASDPSVTGVGGTTTPLNLAGQIAGPITAWGVSTSAGGSGTGGGTSAYFTLPTYQSGLPGIIGSTRNVPDLALDGDPGTGVALLEYADPSFGGAFLNPIGGTSVAAPEMAAMWALVVQACKQSSACASKGSGAHPYRLGNPDPLIYGIYGNATTYGATFLSVLYGNNSLTAYCSNPQNAAGDPVDCPTPGPGATPAPATPPLDPGFSANPNGGYNQLTGVGVPFARSLIRAVVGV
jgi:subtilase family serine protease